MAFPQFTSCSPGWVKYLEHFYPEYIPNLSSAKSPQQMFGAVIKTYYAKLHNIDPKDIVTVALMPCSAKKFECNRPEMDSSGFKDVDYGLTTRELAQMIKEAGIHLPDMPKSDFDDPFGDRDGLGRDLRRDRRRDGSGAAHGDRAGDRRRRSRACSTTPTSCRCAASTACATSSCRSREVSPTVVADAPGARARAGTC